MIALAFALQLLATGPDALPQLGSTPLAPGAPNFAQLTSIVGVSPDSSTRLEFLAAFRGAFASDDLPGERLSAGKEWKGGMPLPNRFRLLEGSEAGDAWQMEVSIGSPRPLLATRDDQEHPGKKRRVQLPKLTVSRGMIVALTVHVPASPGVPDRIATSSAAFYFPSGASAEASLGVPATGYRFPWREAGRIAGTLVLEALHRETGDLNERERMDIAPAVRFDPSTGGNP